MSDTYRRTNATRSVFYTGANSAGVLIYPTAQIPGIANPAGGVFDSDDTWSNTEADSAFESPRAAGEAGELSAVLVSFEATTLAGAWSLTIEPHTSAEDLVVIRVPAAGQIGRIYPLGEQRIKGGFKLRTSNVAEKFILIYEVVGAHRKKFAHQTM